MPLFLAMEWSVSTWVLGSFCEEAVPASFFFEDLAPEVVGSWMKDSIHGGLMDEPGVSLHFSLQLAGAPTSVARKATDLLSG